MSARDMYEKDYYAILGVQKNADGPTIKKVYRKLAREFHPDTSKGGKTDEARFKEISEAYEVLSDPKSRAEYDEARAMYASGRFRNQNVGTGNFNDIFAGSGDINDMLSGLFGQRTRGPRRGADVETETTISFRDSVNGLTLPLRLSVDNDGTRSINARIPAGVVDGSRIRLKGKGGPGERGAASGDLFVHIRVTPHPVFGRKGDNLTITVPVTFAEAALGADIEVPTLDGGSVRVRLAPGTSSGRTLRVKGKGIPKSHGAAGDLLVTIEVVVPQRLDAKEREALEQFAEASAHHNAREEFQLKARQR